MAPQTLNPCTLLPRRLQIVFSLTALIVCLILFFGSTSSSSIPYAESLSEKVQHLPKPGIPKIRTPSWINPFRAPAHAPPVQANSTSGEAKWFSDWKWQNPFSSSVTLDENRAVLPPMMKRAPVYTYYDTTVKRDDKTKEAENELLLIWRRAWWAQGFRPVVLGKPEALNNPLYRTLQGLEVEPELEIELLRWLAWGNMGTGILANWLALPMAPYADPQLSFLRRGDYPHLTRYEGLENGFYIGEKTTINDAVKAALASADIKTAKSIVDAIPKDTFEVDPQHDAIAFYSTSTIRQRYKLLAHNLGDPGAQSQALAMLPQLITSHLHTTWQNTFTSGIAILKPLPAHTTHLIEPAVEIARNL
ncbi:hypothetical protein LTR66_009128, partial [Elasticomyces elasticus]